MKFKDLKKSTLYQTSDFDDMEVMMLVSRNGKKQYEPLCFLGICPLEGHEFVVVGGYTEIQRMVENGEMKAPESYKSPSETPELNYDDGEDENPIDKS